MTIAAEIDACKFFLTEEQAGMAGAPPRPGRICEDGTNTQNPTREFIVKALPNSKYVQDNLSLRIILKFLDQVQCEIDTNAPTMRARPSQR